MASLDEVVTAVKNLVTAVNGAAQTYAEVNGVQTQANITAPILLKQGAGRLGRVSVITAGTTPGYIYDSIDVTASSNPLYQMINTPGIVMVGLPFSLGLVVRPGSGQVVAVSFA